MTTYIDYYHWVSMLVGSPGTCLACPCVKTALIILHDYERLQAVCQSVVVYLQRSRAVTAQQAARLHRKLRSWLLKRLDFQHSAIKRLIFSSCGQWRRQKLGEGHRSFSRIVDFHPSSSLSFWSFSITLTPPKRPTNAVKWVHGSGRKFQYFCDITGQF